MKADVKYPTSPMALLSSVHEMVVNKGASGPDMIAMNRLWNNLFP